jgi:hypothetical protein
VLEPQEQWATLNAAVMRLRAQEAERVAKVQHISN